MASGQVRLPDARRMLVGLRDELRSIAARDPEQEVRGHALATLDAVIRAARHHLPPGHPVIDQAGEVISPEAVVEGEPIRAVDMLLVVTALEGALPNASSTSRRDPSSPAGADPGATRA